MISHKYKFSQFLVGSALMIAVVHTPVFAAGPNFSFNPFGDLWNAISNLQQQINALTSGSGSGGATGATGAMGSTGATGLMGLAGETGASGAVGSTGVSGFDGATGATGTAGATGATGPAGTNNLTRYIVVTAVTINANSSGEAIAQCHPGDQVLSGGFDNGFANVTQSRPALITEGWLVDANTTGDFTSRTFTAYAWCNKLTP